MRKRFRVLAAAVVAGMFLAGCELPEENPGELTGVSVTTEAAAVATETVPVAEPTEAPTQVPTEAAAPFEVGQQVFCVYQHEGGTGLRRFFVVSVEGDFVAVTTAIPGSGEEGELLSFPVTDCYADSADAWVAAGKEPLE